MDWVRRQPSAGERGRAARPRHIGPRRRVLSSPRRPPAPCPPSALPSTLPARLVYSPDLQLPTAGRYPLESSAPLPGRLRSLAVARSLPARAPPLPPRQPTRRRAPLAAPLSRLSPQAAPDRPERWPPLKRVRSARSRSCSSGQGTTSAPTAAHLRSVAPTPCSGPALPLAATSLLFRPSFRG